MTLRIFRISFAVLAMALWLPGAAAAQSGAPTSSLEPQRQAVFTQLLAAPADPALMLEYARLSVRMRDFEAAAATLERFVALDPANVGARVELAVAYFSLGANAIAQYHLAVAEASGALSPAQTAEVARYRAEAESRDAPNRVSGQLSFGRSWLRGQIDDSGLVGSVALAWRADMGGRNADDWLTQLSLSRYAPGEQSLSQQTVGRLRTGPEIRLTGDAFGPRLQPYLEVSGFRETGSSDYDAVAIGLAYQHPLTAYWSTFADVQMGRGNGVGSTPDFDFHEASLGIGLRPSRDTRIRALVGYRHEDREEPLFPTEETTRSLRLEALHAFDTGLAFLPRQWEARATASRVEVEEENVFGPFPESVDTSYGAGLRAFVTDALFIETRGARLERVFSNSRPTETRHVYSVQIGWEF